MVVIMWFHFLFVSGGGAGVKLLERVFIFVLCTLKNRQIDVSVDAGQLVWIYISC